MLRRLIFAASAVFGVAAAAQDAPPAPVVTSAGPDSVSVTLYRDPARSSETAIDRNSPNGFALITETRTLRLPAGRSTIRFEGVAGNIFPETAIVSGLPQDVREKNLDADLLSARSLYDRALGRRVMIRRTDRATGKVIEQQAIVRSGAGGAAVLQTARGFEDYQCSGMPETLVYDGVPAGLSAKPTLSIETDSAGARDAKITLSYLAGGFDWQADYVVRMRPDGRGADLFAWITLASSDVTSFAGAGTQVIAGKPNRTADWSDFGDFGDAGLTLKCWSLPEYDDATEYGAAMAPPPPPPPPVMMMAPPAPMAEAMDIVVTASRVAKQEELGDFKLYRIPDRVTVASKAQKQVALLSKDAVPMTALYVSDIYEGGNAGPVLTLRAKNRVADGLGLPLPAGQVAVFEPAGARDILVGESSTDDKAIGEDVEFKLDKTPGVNADIARKSRKDRVSTYALTVTNANSWPVRYEAKIAASSGAQVKGLGTKLVPRDGRMIWALTVPANGEVGLSYQVKIAKSD